MTDYWYAWPIGIVLWLALGWAEFGVLESRALSASATKRQITLSTFVYTIFSKFPLSVMIAGLAVGYFAGVLSAHFLWHWCPPGSLSAG